MTGLSYLDVLPVLAKLAVLERELALVGGQAVFWKGGGPHGLSLCRRRFFASK